MDINNFKRLNLLPEKVLSDNATQNDLYEFVDLLNQWKSSDDLKVYGSLYTYNKPSHQNLSMNS